MYPFPMDAAPVNAYPAEPFMMSRPPSPPMPGPPSAAQYVTLVEPTFIEHLMKHKGKKIVVTTTAGKLEGILSGIAVDHLQLTLDGKAAHVRIAQTVYFEGMPL